MRGIRIAVDYSWFVVLFLVIFWLSGYYADVLPGRNDGLLPYGLAVASALAFFGSILLHELGHAVVAIRDGIAITEIKLWLFGGVARMSRDSESAASEFKIAAAGPLVSLGLALGFGIAGLLVAGSEEFWAAMRVDPDAGTPGLLALVAWLATINAAVLLFNLIPAFPLDGGRIVRAIAWWRTGDRSSATRFAARLGQGFSYLFMAVGFFWLVQGDALSGVWLAMIGWILGQAARSAAVQTAVADRIEGITVADIMDREPVAIPDGLSAERALDEYFLRYRWPWFPVVDASRRFRGLLRRPAIDALGSEGLARATVAELIAGEPGEPWRVSDQTPLDSLLGNESLRKLGALIAVDGEGRLSGVVTVDQVGRALQGALSAPPRA